MLARLIEEWIADSPGHLIWSEDNTICDYYQGDGFLNQSEIEEFAKYGYKLEKVEIAKPRGLQARFRHNSR